MAHCRVSGLLEQRLAADCLQPPLRSGFRQQLKAGVAMTSHVKSWQQIFLGLQHVFFPRCIGSVGASNRRRLLLLLAVGWVPSCLPPSGACLILGASILYSPLNAAAGSTTPGLRLCRCTWGTCCVAGCIRFLVSSYGVPGTSVAMAHMQPANSRARATVPTVACLPRATRRR